MALSGEWFSATRICGTAGYGLSLLTCLIASVRYRRDGVRRTWLKILTAVQALLLLDMVFNWRWLLHDYWMREAQAQHVYEARRSPQLLLLVVLVLVLAIVAVGILKQFRGRTGVTIAVLGTLLSVGLWCIETLSYHYLDAVFHAMIGGVMAIGLLWIALALFTCAGLWIDIRGR